MAADDDNTVTTVSIITRRLKEGKSYEDFRKAWYHSTGFGIRGEGKSRSGNRMFTLLNIFDPREIIVIGFNTTTMDELEKALGIEVAFRESNPLDAVIEPEIGRRFCTLIAEDDFSAAGEIPYRPALIAGKETDIPKAGKNRQAIAALFAAAAAKRDAINEARPRKEA